MAIFTKCLKRPKNQMDQFSAFFYVEMTDHGPFEAHKTHLVCPAHASNMIVNIIKHS